MWKRLRSAKDTVQIETSVVIDGADKAYYDEHGHREVCERLGTSPISMNQQGVVLTVEAVQDSKGPGSSGYNFLKAKLSRKA